MGRFWLVVIPAACALVALTMVASAATPTSSAGVLRVSYLGPGGQLSGLTTLRAGASTRGGRVVAVTFLLDGKPLGSDTTRPFSLDIDARTLPTGTHEISVAAVDSLGRRVKSRPSAVTVSAGRAGPLTVSSRRALHRALVRLARGNAEVRLGPGRYELSEIRLGENARLMGSGTSTVIAAPSGSYDGILIVNGSHVLISDLVLDGAGQGPGDGQAIQVRDGAADVRIARVKIVHIRETGIDAWGHNDDVSVQDSVLEGDGRADTGVLFDQEGCSNSSVIRTRVRGFRSFGINFAFLPYDDPHGAPHALALDNVVTDVTDPAVDNGTSEGGIWSGGVEAALIGNVVRRTGWDGIETVGSSLHVTIVGNTVSTTKTGIYLEHATNDSLISGNRISGVDTGVVVEWRYEGTGSNGNRFVGNTVRSAKRGIFIEVGNDGNAVLRNVFIKVFTPVVFQGSSNNTASGNRACGNGDPVVTESEGRRDDGSMASAEDNRLSNNLSKSCTKLAAQS